MSDTSDATCGAGSLYRSGEHEVTKGFRWGRCCTDFFVLYFVYRLLRFRLHKFNGIEI